MAKKSDSKKRPSQPRLSELLRIPADDHVDVATLDPRATPGFPGKTKDDVPAITAKMAGELSDLQERLFAEGRSNPDSAPNVLVVLQGMDTSGKGGIIRHAFGLVDPQGLHLHAFKAPTSEERQHDFLWRVRNALPGPGMIGIFDRSHYEDVLIVRVDELIPQSEWSKRYDQINDFEAELAAKGTKIIKCFLNVSADEQKARLAARLEDPSKYWKYNPGDLDTRAKWDKYMDAYGDALGRCNTDAAPWYHIPADRKWYRNWAVTELLRETLEDMQLQWPAADFDVAEQQKAVAAS